MCAVNEYAVLLKHAAFVSQSVVVMDSDSNAQGRMFLGTPALQIYGVDQMYKTW
jgi:hypothetical protein